MPNGTTTPSHGIGTIRVSERQRALTLTHLTRCALSSAAMWEAALGFVDETSMTTGHLADVRREQQYADILRALVEEAGPMAADDWPSRVRYLVEIRRHRAEAAVDAADALFFTDAPADDGPAVALRFLSSTAYYCAV